MPLSRIYQPYPFANQTEITLDAWGVQHIKALRLRKGNPIIIFNGDGNDHHGTITEITTKKIQVEFTSKETPQKESKLILHLLQAISKGERMDYTIQKSTELGVTSITPIISERCEVHLSPERWEKRQRHWQQIAISACEQTGRTHIPMIHFPIPLTKILKNSTTLAIILDPDAEHTLKNFAHYFEKQLPILSVLIGPEGGFSDTEINYAKQTGFQCLRLGPRILRTETAAPVLLAALHAKWGDFV